MKKLKAIELLGGSVSAAAEAVGVSYQAVDKWPDDLPPRIADRVLAALARKHLPGNLIGEEPSEAPPSAGAHTGVDRRDPNRINPFPDLDRRAPAGG